MITSRTNPLICEIAKLSDKKYRDENKLFIFEGKKLLDEAVSANVDIKYIFYTEDNCDFFENKLLNICKNIISESVYAKITEEKSPEGILCVAKYLDNSNKNVKIYNYNNYSKIFILSSIRDPGNLGTIIRTARAFGIEELILSSDCADIYNSKTIRASMGALFRQKIIICEDLIETIQILKSNYKIYAAVIENAEDIRNIEFNNTCFVLGNEGHGLSDDIINICDHRITIPMAGGMESLNVSAAAAVLMWEGYKQW